MTAKENKIPGGYAVPFETQETASCFIVYSRDYN